VYGREQHDALSAVRVQMPGCVQLDPVLSVMLPSIGRANGNPDQ
jgi:hypothetical protein